MATRAPMLAHRAWDSLGNGALFTTRIRRPDAVRMLVRPDSPKYALYSTRASQSRCSSTTRTHQPTRPSLVPYRQQNTALTPPRRILQTSRSGQQEAQTPAKTEDAYRNSAQKASSDPADEDPDEIDPFKRSDKAAQASQINLSAKLSTEGPDGEGTTGGTWREITRLLGIARPEVRTLSLAFGFLLISSGVTMCLPFSIGRIMDAAAQDRGTMFGLPMEQFFIGLGTLLACGACANYGRIILLRIVGERIVTKLRSQLFKRTFIQNAEFFDANRVGDLISRLGSDTIIVGKSITQNVSDGLRSLVSATAGLTMMAWVSVKLTGVLAIFLPPVALGAFFYGRAIRNLSRRIQKNLGTLTKIAEERLGNVRTSQAFVGELQEVHRYNTQTRKIFSLGRREAFISATFFSASGFMGNMTFLALLYVGGGMVRSGAISIGEMTSFLMYAGYAGSSLFGLSAFYSELMKGVGAATRLFELQDREPTISPTKGEMIKSARGTIEFKDVTFSYPTRPAVEIFKDLSFQIKQGSNVAIVAPSGAGKSTVASLLMRFYTPSSGTITIAGRDISKLNAKQLRRKIGYVGQEPVLFSGTIAENIAYGKPLASRSEIVSAARRANCQFISDFPDGLETFVGARGTQLSGGQKQRIAIARALLKEPDILILDEATSALDAESETLVNQALHNMLQGNNTTMSIAHRLSTIQRSDLIICIGSDGKVAETGTYKELSANKDGAFAKLMEWQMSGGAAAPPPGREKEVSPEPTEEERMKLRLEEGDRDQVHELQKTGQEGAEEEVIGEPVKARVDEGKKPG
ncbi:ATP-binding cassette permease mdl1 [Vermiconidia calcicola]|uniref:ATP-binding cassette permease mdl1 n=1 Tax=Vermiconidia calcicola TaxID=1690605 RepID=A0ACC3NA62_9PEZI|nr:ATP-binding cassette permease mdl1 [Vermiconidia calcicola]